MKKSTTVACVVTLTTLIICYIGIRKELQIAKLTPPAPIKLVGAGRTR